MIALSQKQVECIEFINKESNKEIFVYGNCRSGKTFAIITNLVSKIANLNSRNLILIYDTKSAKLLIKYYIEPICKELNIDFKFNVSDFCLIIGNGSEIRFLFLPYKSPINYLKFENIIIFGKHGLEFIDYTKLVKISEKIILEDNPFNSHNKNEIKNNREDWIYTYFIRGIIPYKGDQKIASNAVTFQLNNQDNLPKSVINNMPEHILKED